jgi:type IV secretory pathway VirJ component
MGKNEKDPAAGDNSKKPENIPLVITKAKVQNKEAPVALVISGDGGWYSFEQSIADNLANQGIPTIGLDSRKYFWNRTSPEKTAVDMAAALNYYSKEWGRERYLLIGYSLGAEIVPFIVTRLPQEMRSRISSAVLLSPEADTDFEIHISNMLGIGNINNSYKVMDEIIKMQAVPTLIIIGEDEKTEVPELLSGTTVKIEKIPGGHHYNRDTALIMKIMKDNQAF